MAALKAAPQSPDEILAQESTLVLPAFNADIAWSIGTILRNRLRSLTSNPTVISITLANSNRILFQVATQPGAEADNESWVQRKRATVLRWGHSTWYIGRKYEGDEAGFAAKFGLPDGGSGYAIHGGGVPIFVKSIEGPIGVIVVSGLKQDQDHQVVVESILEYLTTV